MASSSNVIYYVSMNSPENQGPRDEREEKSKIEELKKSLYSRNAPAVTAGRRLRLRPKNYDVKTDWDHPKDTFEDDFADETDGIGFMGNTFNVESIDQALEDKVDARYEK